MARKPMRQMEAGIFHTGDKAKGGMIEGRRMHRGPWPSLHAPSKQQLVVLLMREKHTSGQIIHLTQ